MTGPTVPPAGDEEAEVPEVGGLRHIVGGWITAVVASAVVGLLVLSATGHVDSADEAPFWALAVMQAGLWVGLAGAPLLAAREAGTTLRRGFGLRVERSDVLPGVVVGVLAQLVLVPLVSLPWLGLLRLLGADVSFDDLSDAARGLSDRATDPFGVTLFVLATVIGAPIVEELFFRGLVQGTARRRMAPAAAIAVSSVVFGLIHFQGLQLPALIAFGAVLGWMAHRTGRLGMGIVTHAAFNAVTVFILLVVER